MNQVSPPPSRFMLWIDGVGGFLVCEGAVVTLGQPAPGYAVDVPIMADVSRRHAAVRRDGEHYLFEPYRPCRFEGRSIAYPVRLADDSIAELGGEAGHGAQLRFTQPSVCGRTARLDLVSRHRLQPHADGVILLADACLVGPEEVDHIVAPRLRRRLVLHRRADGGLVFRTEGSYDVDGRRVTGTARIERTSRIRGADFSLQLEPTA